MSTIEVCSFSVSGDLTLSSPNAAPKTNDALSMLLR
ncbi:hypothetical protein NK6_7946 [Bradyrhizobium diazoefficiens]|uniref:Uncharacterized protein n=1 Tax=Bradyrhizobium diazoefficiens TaxID=1355477 RepID=A0A0E4FXK5_9BRAD|nr:hypothetical protein NK6_7946 [Bradyrhizobium diazoefficiens]